MSKDSIIDASSVGGASAKWFEVDSEPSSSSSSSTTRESGIFDGNRSRSNMTRDVWLGMKYMESVVAEQVYLRSNARDSGTTLEVSCSPIFPRGMTGLKLD